MQGSSTLLEILTHHQMIVIPYFQRQYIWTKKQIGNLLKDILNTAVLVTKNEKAVDQEQFRHFTGHLTFWADKNNHLNVIDGQQRLTTIFMILDNLRKYTANTKASGGLPYRINFTVTNLLSNYLDSQNPDAGKFGESGLKFKPCYRDLAFYRVLLNYDTPITAAQYDAIREMVIDGRHASHSASMISAHQQIGEFMAKELGLKTPGWEAKQEIVSRLSAFKKALESYIDFVAFKVATSRDAYDIFQRLNSNETKCPLSEMDLLYSRIFTLVSPKSEDEELALIETSYMNLHQRTDINRDEISDLHRHYMLASGAGYLYKNESFSEAFAQHMFSDARSISIPEFIERTDDLAYALNFWIDLRNEDANCRKYESQISRPALFVYRMTEIKLFDKIAPIVLLMAIKRNENRKNAVSGISDEKFMAKASATLAAIESWMVRRTLGRVFHNSDSAPKADDFYPWHDIFKSDLIERLVAALRTDFSVDSFNAFLYANGESMSEDAKCLSNAGLLAYADVPVKFYGAEALRAKLARIILEAVDDHYRASTREKTDDRRIHRAKYDVDHISPKALAGQEGGLTEDECYSLGNLTLLSPAGNRKKKHHTDALALECFARAQLDINKDIITSHFGHTVDYHALREDQLAGVQLKWGSEMVRARHAMLIQAVTMIWPSLTRGEEVARSEVALPKASPTVNLAVSNG